MIETSVIEDYAKTESIDITVECLKKFEKILAHDGFTLQDIIDQLRVEENRDQVFKAGEGSGASGSFFFFTKCKRFIIKTLRRDEKLVLMKMLDDYGKHISYLNNKSLLTRIYGLFTVKTPKYADIDLIIM